MADDTTRLIISVETLLKGLDKTLRGLAQVEKQLKSVASVKVGAQASTKQIDRAAVSARRLELQQARLAQQQQRVDQTAQRLTNTQARLDAATQRVTKSTGQQADAHVRAFRSIERSTAEANREIRRGQQGLVSFGNSLRSVGQGLASLGATFTVTLTAPILALGTASVAAAVRLDSLKRGLGAIVGSSAEAAVQLARLTQLAKLPGIGFEEAIQGSIRLQAVGFSAKEAERNLKEFANAVALTGGGRDELARVTVQLGQLAAKGKVLSQDLRPIIEAAPAVGRALKQAFGTVNADDIAELTTSSREFLDVLVGELEKLPRAAAGAKNSFENFRDTVFRAAAAIGDTLLPPLIALADILGPVVTVLAEAFKTLPLPLRAAGIAAVGLLAALGPILFIFGQMALAVGRLVVGFQQYNLQLIQTNVQLHGVGAAATRASASLGVLRGALIGMGAGLVGIVAQLALGAAAFIAFSSKQKQSAEASQEQLDATKAQIDALKEQEQFLVGLQSGVKRTADEQERLRDIYRALNIDASTRIQGISDEEKRLVALQGEVKRLLQLRLQEREQQIAQLAANLANTLAQNEADQQRRDSITDQIQANGELSNALKGIGTTSEQTAKRIDEMRKAGVRLDVLLDSLPLKNKALADEQANLGEKLKTSKEETERLQTILRGLGVTSAEQARQFLVLAQTLGFFEGNIDEALPKIRALIDGMKDGTTQASRFSKELGDVRATVDQLGEAADEEQKKRQKVIGRFAALSREAGRDFKNATEFMRGFIRQVPELEAAIKRQAEIQGKTVTEIIAESLGGEQDRGSGTLRSAQERLADALADVQQEAAENTIARERAKNDDLLRINELRFRRELTSFQAFIVEKARLEREAIQGEIDRQKKIAELAAADADRATRRAGATTGAEQVRVWAEEQRALATMTQAETKILELRSRQREVTAQTVQELDQFTEDRLRQFRELSRELDEIIGKEGDAARAAIDERFAETLRALRKEMELANQDFVRAQAAGNRAAAGLAQATFERLRNQTTIIEQHKRELGALVEIRETQETIRRAEEAQRNLEQDLAFQVEFRGLKEEEAIRLRLAGEAKVREVIQQQRVQLEVLLETLRAAGLTIPQALTEAIEQLRVASLGLGELPFVEQFRLAQKEFERLNDERIRKIQDVERAVAHRDISELQGRIAIKIANGEYVGALERQLELLRAIAAQSGDQGLQQQAADAAQVAADVRAATTEIADFDAAVRATSIDALRDGFSQFFQDIASGSRSAKDALLDMLNSVLSRINALVAERAADKLIAALFGILGGGSSVGGPGSAIASGLGGLAAGDIVQAAPRGRVIRVAEGGYDEAILTTDPRYATRQASILREYLQRTKGLFGRVPGFAEGAMVSANEAEASLLASLSPRFNVPVPDTAVTVNAPPSSLRLRQIFVDDQRRVADWVNSPDGEQVLVDFIHRHAPVIRRIR